VQKALDLGIPFLTLKTFQNGPMNSDDKTEFNSSDDNQTISLSNIDIPGPAGIELVLSCMEEFPDNAKVQQNALDVILKSIMRIKKVEIKCGDGRKILSERPNCILSVLNTFESPFHKRNTSIQWRAITILMEFTMDNQDVCRLIAGGNGCESVLNACKRFRNDSVLFQLALWTLSNLCQEGM
jgi:hypothetical protein